MIKGEVQTMKLVTINSANAKVIRRLAAEAIKVLDAYVEKECARYRESTRQKMLEAACKQSKSLFGCNKTHVLSEQQLALLEQDVDVYKCDYLYNIAFYPSARKYATCKKLLRYCKIAEATDLVFACEQEEFLNLQAALDGDD